MRLVDVFETSTRSGTEISFARELDVRGDNNRGWQEDLIIAEVDGERAGHLRVAFIPSERFAKHYPSIINYVAQIDGKGVLPFEKRNWHYTKLQDVELHKLIYSIQQWFFPEDAPSVPTPYSSRREALAQVERLETAILKTRPSRRGQSYARIFNDFAEFQVDKPHVAYSFVLDHFRGQHIGLALYIEMGKWLQERGMNLWASGLQTENAQGVWKYFEKKGWVRTSNGEGGNEGRRYLIVPA